MRDRAEILDQIQGIRESALEAAMHPDPDGYTLFSVVADLDRILEAEKANQVPVIWFTEGLRVRVTSGYEKGRLGTIVRAASLPNTKSVVSVRLDNDSKLFHRIAVLCLEKVEEPTECPECEGTGRNCTAHGGRPGIPAPDLKRRAAFEAIRGDGKTCDWCKDEPAEVPVMNGGIRHRTGFYVGRQCRERSAFLRKPDGSSWEG